MFSTFDLRLLLYVIRLAGWLKHCNLSLSLCARKSLVRLLRPPHIHTRFPICYGVQESYGASYRHRDLPRHPRDREITRFSRATSLRTWYLKKPRLISNNVLSCSFVMCFVCS